MVVPEKSNQVTKIVIPSYVFKGGILTAAFLGVLATIMVLDYANVMNQINENKQLKIENRQLKQNVQVFKTKMVTIENTLDRVKTFVTKLRIITNIEDTGPPPQSLQQPIAPAVQPSAPPPPSAAPQSTQLDENKSKLPGSPIKKAATSTPVEDVAEGDVLNSGDILVDVPSSKAQPAPANPHAEAYEQSRSKRQVLLAALMNDTVTDSFTLTDADTSLFVKSEFEKLDAAYEEVNKFALAAEQETQDILERLGEKRALLASTPTRIPTLGYITSDYGVRINPYDSRRKMHEGIDIANRYGADIVAPADGIVKFAGVKPGYGKIVIIDHANGIETRYAHNSKIDVKVGERVKRGQTIAAVGNTGHSTGPHCHYEVHANGLPVDPCWYILDQPGLCRSR